MKETINGKYGPFMADTSFIIRDSNGNISSTSIVTLYKNRPLLAFAMTLPKNQGSGMAKFLIKKSINALALNHTYKEIHLGVTDGNPAQKLYEKIGFTLHSSSWQKNNPLETSKPKNKPKGPGK